jgi:hypothetical protein
MASDHREADEQAVDIVAVPAPTVARFYFSG